jgi:hypothetical protein
MSFNIKHLFKVAFDKIENDASYGEEVINACKSLGQAL